MLARDTHNYIRILVVDDNPQVARGIADLLDQEDDLHVVGTANDGYEALEHADLRPLDIVLMDLKMPNMGGLEATHRLKRSHPLIPVLIHSVYDDDHFILEALRAGAAGYLLKETDAEDTIKYIRAALRGDWPLPPEVAHRLLKQMALDHFSVKTAGLMDPIARGVDGRPIDVAQFRSLSSQEFAVLNLIAQGKTNPQIADDLHLSICTVKGHVEQILTKLRVSDRTQAAVRGVSLGIVRDHA